MDYLIRYTKTKAAQALCITRATLDVKIKAGLIETVRDEFGNLWVDGDSLRAYHQSCKNGTQELRERVKFQIIRGGKTA